MKEFDQETFADILASKGVKIADYVLNSEADEEDLMLRPLEVTDHTKGKFTFVLSADFSLFFTFFVFHVRRCV